jgi:protein phosphatase 1 regulatory subunit 7
LENLKFLSTLEVSNNKIKILENVSHLQLLDEFWASYNLFESFEQVRNELGNLKIRTVYFEGSPICKDVMYRRKLKDLMPTLVQIDATLVRTN